MTSPRMHSLLVLLSLGILRCQAKMKNTWGHPGGHAKPDNSAPHSCLLDVSLSERCDRRWAFFLQPSADNQGNASGCRCRTVNSHVLRVPIACQLAVLARAPADPRSALEVNPRSKGSFKKKPR